MPNKKGTPSAAATAKARGTKGPRGAADGSNKINVAGMHKDELEAAIESANRADLKVLDAQLAAQGWTPDGLMRARVAARLTDMEG